MRAARIILGLLLTGATAGAQLRPGLLESLVQDSPFQPGQGGGLPADGGSAQFEFRGVVAETGGYLFSVYDPGRREAGWVKLDEPGRPFVARRYDPAKDTLVIEHNGQALTLNLKRAAVQPLTPAPPMPVSPPPLPTAAGAAPPSTNATNAQEAQRLQNIADEIRRRRALRQLPPADKPAGKP
ncbi:hypothetical protein [Opitutus sp. GAS368]|uniref:hypothetical protein n=1 Tax=Opitutus sp. GAS368 TaxID=1882749 RepID=UPI00087D0A08|nr:hypothetical protein [Opitutus sp. GAS368]SDS41846.1 hypothetical protein SAMN05444173_2838 [Opitutus sp. GAS368]